MGRAQVPAKEKMPSPSPIKSKPPGTPIIRPASPAVADTSWKVPVRQCALAILCDAIVKDGARIYVFKSTLFARNGASLPYKPGDPLPFPPLRLDAGTDYGDQVIIFFLQKMEGSTPTLKPFAAFEVYKGTVPVAACSVQTLTEFLAKQ
ncbi:MAG: hypothetical protein ABIP97_10235 [Chthoniobacterales bacterium]